MSIPSTHSQPFVETFEDRKSQIEKIAALFAVAKLPQQASTAYGRVIRPLLPPEVDTLKGPCHCTCPDWSKIRLLLSKEDSGKDQSSLLEQTISHNAFSDVIVIGLTGESVLSEEHASDACQKLTPGVHGNTLISNCIIEAHARVYHNALISDTYIGVGAVLFKCGTVSCTKNVTFGQISLSVGAESGGGRKVTVTAESTMIDVCRKLGMSAKDTLQQWTSNMPCDVNIVGAYSIVRDTPTLENVYLTCHSTIAAACSVRNATLLSDAKICNGCTVTNVLLQWSSSIADNSSVSDALLMEEAHSGPHSLVASSILGPDVHVSAGEVHSSVLGPNTNAHHQSLLIGVLWPLGRGNVGYGANVGSNHTGRLPDQESTAGEGTFWGLSTVIKFPVDLSYAPYSIVAAGTNMPPQRITMPFSLIVEQKGVCNIIPGWVLQSSPYTLSRSEAKFAKRRKAKRHSFYTGWKIIRPDIVDMCIQAREALDRAGTESAAVYKTDKQVVGIGACHLSEKGRVTGMKAYTQCIQLYALRGLLDRIVDSRQSLQQVALRLQHGLAVPAASGSAGVTMSVSWPPLPWDDDDSSLWSHQLAVLRAEFPVGHDSVSWIVDLLQKLVVLQKDYSKRVCDCKARDDSRGAKTVPGYADSHIAAHDDPAVKAVQDETARITETVEKIVGTLGTPLDQARSRL